MQNAKLKAWGGNMKRAEFNFYMNKKFDEVIDKLCPIGKKIKS